MEQLAIAWEATEVRRARRRDPETSHAAASRASEFAAVHMAAIRKALTLGSGTIYEIAERTGLDHVQVARRLPEMRDAKVSDEKRCGPTGRMCRVWELA